MRADRLLSLMMILQTRGRTTADILAQELEVTKRTIYRDIDALSLAGVPVYAIGGPGGGYALLENYRTNLTGLNEEETQAFFMLTIPGPLADLGSNQQLRTAILKLTSALPARYQEGAEHVRQRLHLDAAGWFQQEKRPSYLRTIQKAVWQDQQLQLIYRNRKGITTERMLDPYGLVAKAGVWYLVAATETGMRVFRVSRIETAAILSTQFIRPQTFDLKNYWTTWAAEYEASLPKYPVTLNVSPNIADILPFLLGESVKSLLQQAQPDTDGWRILEYNFELMEEARAFVLGLGTSVKVIAPEMLRKSVLEVAQDIVAQYTN